MFRPVKVLLAVLFLMLLALAFGTYVSLPYRLAAGVLAVGTGRWYRRLAG